MKRIDGGFHHADSQRARKIGYNQGMQKTAISLVLLVTLTACSLQVSDQATPEPSAVTFSTATLMPTFTPRPAPTEAPPTVAPTIEPIGGIVTTQLNVRSGPDQGQSALGLLGPGAQVQVIGKDSSGQWWEIVYSNSPNGTGWIVAQYVNMKSDTSNVPVVQAAVALPSATPAASGGQATSQPTSPQATSAQPTPPAFTATPNGQSAQVTQEINVRAGPGTTFGALGLLNPGDSVTLTGRNQTNTWLQVNYPAGPGGKGWIAALYLKVSGTLDGLPYYDNQGTPVTPPEPVVNQPTPSPTPYAPAPDDKDSQDNPAVKLTFSPSGGRLFSYASDLSSPQGDAEDWVAFTPYGPTADQPTYVYLTLKCSGNGGITATLLQDGQPVPDVQPLLCGQYDLGVKVLGGKNYTLALKADSSGSGLRYVSYVLTLKVNQ